MTTSYRDMSEATRIQFARSEITVSPTIFDAGVEIFSAMIASRQVSDENKDEMMERAIQFAIDMAIKTEKKMAIADEEGKEF